MPGISKQRGKGMQKHTGRMPCDKEGEIVVEQLQARERQEPSHRKKLGRGKGGSIENFRRTMALFTT